MIIKYGRFTMDPILYHLSTKLGFCLKYESPFADACREAGQAPRVVSLPRLASFLLLCNKLTTAPLG